jgi:FkbM family methyltransferase
LAEERVSLPAAVKSLAIATGLYPAARRLSRMVRPSQHQVFFGDIVLYRSLLPPDALCFDVGANIGEKSEALLEAGARVVAFEPNPRVLPELRARCGNRRDFTLVEAAMGSAPGVATLYARKGHENSGLFAGDGTDVIATPEVQVQTLDMAIERFGTPEFCKIDVEGWELEVLKGLSRPIRLISFEFQLNDFGIQKTLACLDRLAGFGASQVNITPAETPRFFFDRWMPLAELRAQFPGDLKRSMPGDHYGDIYVRAELAPERVQ